MLNIFKKLKIKKHTHTHNQSILCGYHPCSCFVEMNNSNFPFPKFPWTRSFITRVACISFHPSRNFPDPRKRYNTFVGRSFWRLVMFVYASSVNGPEGKAEDSEVLKMKEKPLNPKVSSTTNSNKKQSGKSKSSNKSSKESKVSSNPGILEAGEAADEYQMKSEFSLTKSPNNALITGIRGCGKSHLVMTAAAFLTARNVSDLYRIVCIGDCRSWAQSDNPVAYFSLELMMAFRTASERSVPNASPLRPSFGTGIEGGDYNPPGIFVIFDDLRSWMEAVGRRQAIHQDLKLVIFIDQLEELYAPVSSSSPSAKMAARIFELLISLKYPILITSLIPSPLTLSALPSAVRDPSLFAEMRMPAVLTYTDFDMFVEVFEASRKFSSEDDPLMHDLRMWTGAVPAQIAKFFSSNTTSANGNNSINVASRLVKYRTERSKAFSDLITSAVGKMDRLPRMHFLLQVCRMILHIPSEDPQLSPGAAINGLESLFIPAALQKFYHPEEGIVAYRHIPTAVSPAAHYTLCDRKLLAKLAAKWEQVFEAVLSSTLASQNVCLESKRRVIRFYAQFKLFSISFDEELSNNSTPHTCNSAEPPVSYSFAGVNQFNDRVKVSVTSSAPLRRVIFAGLSPTPILIPSGKNSPNLLAPLVFIPGRTDFCFYDFFLAVPTEKTLYAITTCPFETMMDAGQNGSSSASSSSFNTATNAPLNPFTILEMWSKDIKDAGYSKFTIKSVFVEPNDLLAQLRTSSNTVQEAK
jgi:hypothetical protein